MFQPRRLLATRCRIRLPNRFVRSSGRACSPARLPKHHPQRPSTDPSGLAQAFDATDGRPIELPESPLRDAPQCAGRPRGLLNSCARPADIVPSAASFSCCCFEPSRLRSRAAIVRKISPAIDGQSRSSRQNPSSGNTMSRQSDSARAVRMEGTPSSSGTSPKNAPGL